MRAGLVFVAMLGACGDGGGADGERAPECDIPPAVCADGSDAVPPANPPELYKSKRCLDAHGDVAATWSTFRNGQVTYNPATGDMTACWSVESTVALRRTYSGTPEAQTSTDTCWDRDGEPAECAAVLAEYNKAAMPAE